MGKDVDLTQSLQTKTVFLCISKCFIQKIIVII